MKGSDRNKKCYCGSNKKRKKCCIEDEKVPVEVSNFFNNLERDRNYMKQVGIFKSYQQVITRTHEEYLIPLDNSIFKIKCAIELSFYDILSNVAIETLGTDWMEEQGKLSVEKRSYLYKTIAFLASNSALEKVVIYNGKKTGKIIQSNAGFSKDFLTLAFDIFCLRNENSLPKEIIDRLKVTEQYQGARYEIAIAAIFVRLGYELEWISDKEMITKHPEFIARLDDQEIYIEAKSRHIKGVQNVSGSFDLEKALGGAGSGGLLYKALQKNIPENKQFIIFVDMNAVEGNSNPPRWLESLNKSIKKQHHNTFMKLASSKTLVLFTNFSYFYQGFDSIKRGSCLVYNGGVKDDLFLKSTYMQNIVRAIKYHGFIPDHHISQPITIFDKCTEYPQIKNLYKHKNRIIIE